MGGNVSSSLDIPKKYTVNLSSHNLTFVPERALKSHSNCQKLVLKRNKIQRLPLQLPNLRELNISMNGLNIIYPQMVKSIVSYTNLECLDISSNCLGEFPVEILQNKKLKKLNLFSNRLREIKISETNIEELDIGHNLFTNIPELPPTLNNLAYDFNYLHELKYGFPNLKRLSLVLTSIEIISEEISFPNLEFLNISKNRLKTLPNMSKFAPSLKVLDVSDNFLTEFPIVPLNIEDVNISSNKIKTLPENIITFVNLKVLDISHNEIEHIPKLPSSLTNFFFDFNPVESFDASPMPLLSTCFCGFCRLNSIPNLQNTSIKNYFFSYNEITEIEVDKLNHNLVSLDLSNNKIKKLPQNFFTRFSHITELFLNNNCLTSLPQHMTSSLTTLVLTNNKIKNIPSLPSSLTQLYISFCMLKSLPDSISHNSNLTVLDAAGNKLKTIPKLKCIKILNLSNNKLNSFPSNLPPTITNLYLSGNKINELPNNSLCFPELDELDLSCNKIKHLQQTPAMPKLRILRLSNNPLEENVNTYKYSNLSILDLTNTNVVIRKVTTVNQILVSKVDPAFDDPFIHCLNLKPWLSLAEMMGARENMEDSVAIRTNLRGDIDMYALFDGHGGSRTAIFCSSFVNKFAETELKFSQKSIALMVHELDHALSRKGFKGGATLAIALFNGKKLITAHVGDSRIIVLSKSGKVTYSTIDHKPTARQEFERIHFAGGRVENMRLHGILGPSRSMGDYEIPGNIPAPEIHEYEVSEDDRFIVIGCDGVFDVLTNEQIGLISRKVKDSLELAYQVRDHAFSNYSQDNISVITVDLFGRREEESDVSEFKNSEESDDEIPDFQPSSPFVCEGVILKNSYHEDFQPNSPDLRYLSLTNLNEYQ
ncbi:protein phosphatase 2C [Histomonas meleagridis]|uniref:protein phosphatase 2C n=1 Tax=Histomonas meleagridis TaxID=135588 RepID=UPI003559E727|nr:protein phosphatase 2C [Histomonas meleagridis]KAH0806925.1 protein phosphatase 2C [Histomonas meleagridis]